LKHHYFIKVIPLLVALGFLHQGKTLGSNTYASFPPDSNDTDTNKVDLKYPYEDQSASPFEQTNPLIDLNDPENIKKELQYDPITGNYFYVQKMGDSLDYRPENYMTFDEYEEYNLDQAIQQYWSDKISTESEFNQSGDDDGFDLIPSVKVNSQAFDNIFGGNTIDIRPSGSADLQFGLRHTRTLNPALSVRQRRTTIFDFDQRLQVNLIGNIGDKLKLTVNYNTEATFDFENQVKVEYTGYEDEIIQKIEAGNVTLPLQGSLITGSQSLFGIKTALQFGRLTVTTVFSQQRGKKEELQIQGGAQVREFELKADEYDANRHYFLSHFFRDNYEQAMSSPPYVTSPINITRIEVWITNTVNSVENTRNLIGFQDIGESDPERVFNQNGQGNIVFLSTDGFPDNSANSLFQSVASDPSVRDFNQSTPALDVQGFISTQDYQKVGLARLLTPNEYTLHPLLGIISLNMELQPNQVLAVAFQYTYQNRTYQVGEFSTDVPTNQSMIMKMLKSSTINTNAPIWDLMMKNVYSIGAYQIQQNNFELNLWYLDRRTGVKINYIPEGPSDVNGIPLIQVMEWDKMDRNFNPIPDGVFDFLTGPQYLPYINPQNGKVFFPVLEPFGSHLHEVFDNDPELIEKYAFDSLYSETPPNVRVKFPEKNRFYIRGEYESSISNEISLNTLQIPEGSVQVTAGGRQLIEGQDFQVDYNLGRVKILNQGLLESGIPIKVSLESNSLFNIQQKTLLASRFDYKVSEDFQLGGTIMNLSERPLTQKTSYREEPISNTVIGLDGTYRSESPFLTRFVDGIPGIDTKEPSSFQISGEFATLIPGHSRAIGPEGTSYIDDFEGSQSRIDLRQRIWWSLASIPKGQPNLFPEADLFDDPRQGYNRALLSWYQIDPLFFDNDSRTPDHIQNNLDEQSNHYMRQVAETEVFPNKQPSSVQINRIPTLDLAYYPSEKGPYNYDPVVEGANGNLPNPEQRWAGIQRRVDQQDFDALNIEFIQFWVMDPFNEDYDDLVGQANATDNGELIFNLGTISEDVISDGQNFFENGIQNPPDPLATDPFLSNWGRYTPQNQLVDGFDNDPNARQFQDVGFEGLSDEEETEFYADYVTQVAPFPNLVTDPSQDNFQNFLGGDLDARQADVLERYKRFSNPDGNSPVATSDDQSSNNVRPDQEDINRDKYIEQSESYWQYRVKVSPEDINPANVGNNYITDFRTVNVNTINGQSREVTWYQFRIPIVEGTPIGDIKDFRSIRFMRMFSKGFENPVVMRFARLELIRGEWRKFEGSLNDPGDYIVGDDNIQFDVSAVNIEENSDKRPVNYVLPPNIEREINVGSANQNQLNEQSVAVSLCELPDGQSRAIYRNFDLDILNYNKIRLFVHAASQIDRPQVNDSDLTAFIRLGSDFTDNYYEYEIPLHITPEAPEGGYNNNSVEQRYIVWPSENEVVIDLSTIANLKVLRNREAVSNGESVNAQIPYESSDGKATIRVVGNPSLNEVKTIMMGVRNPRRTPDNPNDDGTGKCVEVWFNELRLTDFDDNAGWAAIVRATAQLADFATISMSGSMSTPGWGSIEKKVSERQRETKQDFDIQANMELGKFFGSNSGIKIPTYVGYSVGIVKPQFAPLAPDIPFEDFVREAYETETQRDSVRRIQQAITERRSINFTNVRKEKTKKNSKKKFYDVSNFGLNYSYTDKTFSDFETLTDDQYNHRGGLTYNFSGSPKNYKPFAKSRILRSNWLGLIRDFNFYLLPKGLSFATDINRAYSERQVRNNNPEFAINPPLYVNKTFDWTRRYSIRWDLTRTLKFDFNANNRALIEEMPGQPDTNRALWRESVLNSLSEFGTNMNYDHAINLTWTVPLKQIPALDWINANLRYNATYTWTRAPFIADSLGNTIQNHATVQANGTLNFVTLYNKSKYLRSLNSKRPGGSKSSGRGRKNRNSEEENKEGEEKDKKKKDKEGKGVLDHVFRALMMIRNGNVTYSQGGGIMLPGYNQGTEIMGMNPGFNAPGVGFIFGQQTGFGNGSSDFLDYAQRNEWLVKNTSFNNAYRETTNERLNLKLIVEPVRDFRIELSTSWDDSRSFTTFNRYYDTLILEDGSEVFDTYNRDSPILTGNFSTNFWMLPSAFSSDQANNVNEFFEIFSENRAVVSRRLGEENRNSTINEDSVYAEGYNGSSADVLIPAFIAAYSGQDPEKVNLNPFAKIYIPDIRITYTGLSKIPALKKLFRSVSLSSAYRSTKVISGYQSNIRFVDDGSGFTDVIDTTSGNFETEFIYTAVVLREAFSPLLNIDLTLQNSFLVRFEVKYDRTLSLQTQNSTVNEIRGTEYVVGLGYTFKQVRFPFSSKDNRNALRSDLKVRGDISLRNTLNINRTLDTQIQPNQATNGSNNLSVRFSADYKVNRNLNLRFYINHIANTPVISTAFPTSTTDVGFSVRFNLSG
jgi:cell surface protein SprA